MTPDSLLVLITENNARASRFQRHLSEELGLPILLVGELNDLPDVAEGAPKTLLLIDLDYLKSTQQELWSNAICQRFGEQRRLSAEAHGPDAELITRVVQNVSQVGVGRGRYCKGMDNERERVSEMDR